MEIKSTLKTLLGIGIKKNTIPMEIKSIGKTLEGILKTIDPKDVKER